VRHTVTTINSGFAAGKSYGSIYVRLVDRKERQRSVSDMAVPLRERLERIPGITVTNSGVTDLGGGKSQLEIELRYYEGRPVIDRLQRFSRSGLRQYRGKDELPKVLNGLGISIISTSKGIMTDAQARQLGVGGEVLCFVA
jgi:ribosomal protein S8